MIKADLKVSVLKNYDYLIFFKNSPIGIWHSLLDGK